MKGFFWHFEASKIKKNIVARDGKEMHTGVKNSTEASY